MMSTSKRSGRWMAAALVGVVLLAGCGDKTKPRESVGVMDNPDSHVRRARDLMFRGDAAEADKSVGKALELNPNFGPALTLRAVIMASNRDAKAKDTLEKGLAACGKARDCLYDGHVNAIRVHTHLGGGEWLATAQEYYDKAVKANKDQPDAYYWMGIAYRTAFDFTRAKDSFRQSIDSDKSAKFFTESATREWQKMGEIEMAMPGSPVGKQVAIKEEISRSDVAALFTSELDLKRLFEKTRKPDLSFKDPKQLAAAKARQEKPAPIPDVAGHPLESSIREVLDLNVKGLELIEGKFDPDKPVTKAEFAFMIQDILVRALNDTELETKFIGENSKFDDVRSDSPYYNAIVVAHSRDILKLKDFAKGYFGPNDPVNGATALLAIRQLKTSVLGAYY